MNSFMLIAAKLPSYCTDILPIIRIIKNGVFPLIQMGIPIILLLLGTIDLGKAVLSSEDKEVKAAQSRLIKRILYAVVIFFMTTIVSLVFNIVADYSDDDSLESGAKSWLTCWNAADN